MIDGYNRYHYECLTDSSLIKIFTNKEDAIKYCDTCELSCALTNRTMYADTFSVFQLNENDEVINNPLYIKAYNY